MEEICEQFPWSHSQLTNRLLSDTGVVEGGTNKVAPGFDDSMAMQEKQQKLALGATDDYTHSHV